ncbi:heme peroxidase, partial [Mycena olivaceomarginata]
MFIPLIFYFFRDRHRLEAFDRLRWDQTGFNALGISIFVGPCDFFFVDTNATGRSDAADWIRTAYHDMATHNANDGTGGLDASIRFGEEQARSENVGDGFNNTLNILGIGASRYVSLADTIAVGAIMAFENCGGPEIPFRGGRVDADGPNTPGVPEPQDSLDSHIAAFARQGFTQTEMISLVACGHSFGGVQHALFPDVVPDLNDPTNRQSPMENATMLSFANSPQLFATTCSSLIARMVDTVPNGVQFTEVVTPLSVKPANLQLILNGDNMVITADVRFWNMTFDANRVILMYWDDHAGGTHNTTLAARRAGTSSAINGRYSASWYGLDNFAFDGLAGIKTMRFTVDGELEDQDGLGFAVDDRVLFSASSCLFSPHPLAGRLDVAVRNGVNPSRIFLENVKIDSSGHPVINETDILPPAQPIAANAVYSIWSHNVTDNNLYRIVAEVDGVNILP